MTNVIRLKCKAPGPRPHLWRSGGNWWCGYKGSSWLAAACTPALAHERWKSLMAIVKGLA